MAFATACAINLLVPLMPNITAIETTIPSGIMPNLVLVRVHTDAGIIGCGETYYTPHAIQSLIHDFKAFRAGQEVFEGSALFE